MFAILLPTLPSDFVVPVIVYIVVIAAMVTKSLSRPTKRFASVGIYLALAG